MSSGVLFESDDDDSDGFDSSLVARRKSKIGDRDAPLKRKRVTDGGGGSRMELGVKRRRERQQRERQSSLFDDMDEDDLVDRQHRPYQTQRQQNPVSVSDDGPGIEVLIDALTNEDGDESISDGGCGYATEGDVRSAPVAGRSIEQRHRQFRDSERAANIAPPRLERVHGNDMVRPLDTHVQQTNAEAMGIVINRFNWPSQNIKDTRAECCWTLLFLENAFNVRDFKNDKRSQQQQQQQQQQRGRSRGPGNKRDYTFIYDESELLVLNSVKITYDRLGISVDDEMARMRSNRGDVFDVERIETYVCGMHAYVLMLKRVMTQHFALFPYQGRQQSEQALLQSAINVADGDPSLRLRENALGDHDPSLRENDVDAEFVPRDINQRLYRLHEKIANIRVVSRGLNLVGSTNARGHGLPMDLLAYGLADSGSNMQGSVDEKKVYPRQRYLSMMLQECCVKEYRRCGDQLYREVKYNGFSTQAYVPLMTIQEFVWRMPHCVAQNDEWNDLTSDKSAQSWMAEYMTKVHNSPMLPDLKRSRYQWSFRNGIYTGNNNRFWKYGHSYATDSDCPFSTGTISALYFDEKFDEALTTSPLTDIKVESVDMIMDAQEWSSGVKCWMWISLGRLFYDVGQYDNWQFAPFLNGLAGTGKSTLVEMMTQFYDTSAVGTLSNNMEDTFGLMAHYDKDLLTAPEVRPDFKLPQAHFQTMVSGERMAIPRKNRKVKEIDHWRTPMILAGNSFPKWFDTGGSLARRVLPFMFVLPVEAGKSAPDLKERIKRDLIRTLVKANRYYLLAVQNYGDVDVWKVVPKEFLASREKISRETNKVVDFLMHCGIENNDIEHYVTLSRFIDVMKAYGKSRNWVPQVINDEDVTDSIKQYINRSADKTVNDAVHLEKHVEAGKPTEIRIFGIIPPVEFDTAIARFSFQNTDA